MSGSQHSLFMQFSERLCSLQSNVFADMDRAKAKAMAVGRSETLAAGQSLIDLSLGSSDLPVAPQILDVIADSLRDPKTHGYLLFEQTRPFREAIAAWMLRRFGVTVDPEMEVLPLIGSQEGTAHLPLGILNPGDYALLLDPGYPSHAGGVYLANGRVHGMPLWAEDGFLPRFADIPADILAAARMMVLSYPHNPTTGVASLAFFESAVEFCQTHGLVLVHDFPYVDFVFDGPPAPSILQADRERTCSIEFFTLSKSYSMGGFRIGYAVGHRDLIRVLRQIKAVVDFNQYQGILNGAIAALAQPPEAIQAITDCFRERQQVFISALDSIGWSIPPPSATMYVWAPLPPPWEQRSVEFCQELVAHTGVAASPGAGFGPKGEGYVRFALVHPAERLKQAVDRIAGFLHT
jgi:aspartate/methionine/tyrosine aminotransferase